MNKLLQIELTTFVVKSELSVSIIYVKEKSRKTDLVVAEAPSQESRQPDCHQFLQNEKHLKERASMVSPKAFLND